jgi:hypothetical protein
MKWNPIFVWEPTDSPRNHWGKLFDYYFERKVTREGVKRWSIEIWLPYLHIYFENFSPKRWD